MVGELPVDSPIRVVVVDDHPAILAGVAAWCAAADPKIEIVAAGADPSVAWGKPGRDASIVVFDLQLRGRSAAFDDVARLSQAGRSVIVYTQRTDHASACRCLALGAVTYLTKAEGPDYLTPRSSRRHGIGRTCRPRSAGPSWATPPPTDRTSRLGSGRFSRHGSSLPRNAWWPRA